MINMKKNSEIPKEALERLTAIRSELDKLSKELGVTEYNLFFTKYADDGVFEWGEHYYKLERVQNLDTYKTVLSELKQELLEQDRFSSVANLKEFQVLCINDTIATEILQLVEKAQSDWIIMGGKYTVFKVKKSIGQPGYTFSLKNDKGVKMKPPYPFQGWHSSRFRLVDYTKLN